MALFEINEAIQRPDRELIEAFSRIAVANLSDAMGNLHTMDSGIQGIRPGLGVCGPAVTASILAGDFLCTIKALQLAQPGDVLVIDNHGSSDTALWGEILSTEAQLKGLAGIVADGAIRDKAGIQAMGFPVFARGTTPRVSGRQSRGEVNVAVQCGGVVVHPGDMVLGDDDGVVVVPLRKAEEVHRAAKEVLNFESDLKEKIAGGENQAGFFGLDALLGELME